MSPLEIWLTIVGMAAVTVITRSAFQMLGDRLSLPARVEHALRYAPACALAALVAPELLLHDGQVFLSPENHRLVAGAVAAAAMLATRNIFFTMASGMLMFTALRLA